MQNQYQQPQGQPMPQPQPQKKYVGGGTAINTQYGELLKISFNDRDLQLMQSMLNEKGWINLNCNRRQQPSQYGQTHSIVIDEWKPQQQAPQQQYQQQSPAQPQYQQQAPAQQVPATSTTTRTAATVPATSTTTRTSLQ